MTMYEPPARRRLREAREEAAAERLAARSAQLFLWRLKPYATAVATAAGIYGAVTASSGWWIAVWTVVSWTLALLLGLGIARYDEGRDGHG